MLINLTEKTIPYSVVTLRLGWGLRMPKNYHDVYKYSLENPEGFWAEAASSIYWTKSWDKVLDDTRPPFYRWFPGAERTHATTLLTVT